ncbi:uracil-xanthine permease family protein [Helicovermis profundi]|uniref:Uracil-xanthine permease family protein n=1 Tax=Helicovermis profundi TaxID=3065157 RepID=A0AAU9E2S5_9FIRM|nr:uracil-xanthine permease family protein [Clostridia bacterium S502]
MGIEKEKELHVNHDAIRDVRQLGVPKMITLGMQHAFTMFGATVLVPIITGLDVSVSLFMAGIGTLLFHLITKGKVPVFLGSSFAFIAPMLAVADTFGLDYARGGIVVAGFIYLILAGLITVFGTEKVIRFFPPVVTGPIILVIGLKLAPVAINMASSDWLIAVIAFSIVTIVSVFGKGFAKIIPVIIALLGTYIIALIFGKVDLSPITQASWFGIPHFTIAKFNLSAIITVAPLALATMVEHVGDILAIGATVEKDFIEDPGLNYTLTGDGIATALSAFVGGPANTTYSENTGVLALTRAWDPVIMRIAALFAICLGLIPKLSSFISTIPSSVIGGISIILFGMIASIGARTLVEHQVDFTKSRNLIVAAVILVLGLGGASLPITIGAVSISIEGMALAAIVGIILNIVLPE